MVDHGRPRSTTVDHGRPRSTTVDHGRPWSTTVDHGRPWSTTVDHGRPRSTMVGHGRTWSTTVDCWPKRSTPRVMIIHKMIIISSSVAIWLKQYLCELSPINTYCIFHRPPVDHGRPPVDERLEYSCLLSCATICLSQMATDEDIMIILCMIITLGVDLLGQHPAFTVTVR